MDSGLALPEWPGGHFLQTCDVSSEVCADNLMGLEESCACYPWPEDDSAQCAGVGWEHKHMSTHMHARLWFKKLLMPASILPLGTWWWKMSWLMYRT